MAYGWIAKNAARETCIFSWQICSQRFCETDTLVRNSFARTGIHQIDSNHPCQSSDSFLQNWGVYPYHHSNHSVQWVCVFVYIEQHLPTKFPRIFPRFDGLFSKKPGMGRTKSLSQGSRPRAVRSHHQRYWWGACLPWLLGMTYVYLEIFEKWSTKMDRWKFGDGFVFCDFRSCCLDFGVLFETSKGGSLKQYMEDHREWFKWYIVWSIHI